MTKLGVLLVCLTMGGVGLYGQSDLQRRAAPAPEYVLGPGDQISLHIDDVEDVPTTPISIDPSGFVDIPLAGRVQAGGLTLSEFKAALFTKLSPYLAAPKIAANLVASGSQPISVVGEVNTPGVHQLSGSKRLLEVISLSGGLKADAGPVVLVTREARWGGINNSHARLDPSTGYTTATFSLDALLTAKAPEDNIVIEPNDVVSIPKAELIYVLGDVKKAGGFQLSTHSSISLLFALSLAEGLTPDNSAHHARILRPAPGGDGQPAEIPVDIIAIEAGKAPDVPLLPNDVLFVPHSGIKVASRRAFEAALGITTGLLIYR